MTEGPDSKKSGVQDPDEDKSPVAPYTLAETNFQGSPEEFVAAVQAEMDRLIEALEVFGSLTLVVPWVTLESIGE